MKTQKNINKGFSRISHQYEALDKTSSLISWMRMKVRNHLQQFLKPRNTLLEINCGSGIDAVYLAKKGYRVHAIDLASGMIDYVRSKIVSENLENNLSCELLPFNELYKLNEKKYEHLFSNFGGLNCVSLTDLKQVFQSFNELLKPSGTITLVIMPKICIWEFLKIFKADKTAFRRLKKNGVLANIEGEKVHTYYHSAKQIKKMLSADFTEFTIENICFLAPTGNHVNYPEKHPNLFKTLSGLDSISNKIPFLQGYGDYYIISARKKV